MSQSPPTVPVCYRHPGRETYIRCTRCDRPICPECMRDAAVGHQCPECVAEGRRTQRPVRTAFGGGAAGQRGLVTKTLLGLNVLMMILSVISGGGEGLAGGGWGGLLGGYTPLIGWGANYAGDPVLQTQLSDGTLIGGIVQGEYYRMFTSLFLHYGVLHLLMNMWALWVLGRNLESALGPLRFLGLYLLSGLGGSVAVYYFAPNALTAGASGAIFGLFAGLFLLLRRMGRDTSAVLPVIIINIVFTFAVPGISIAGHLGGMVVGGLVGTILAYAPREHRNLVQGVGCGAIFLLLVALTIMRTAMLSI
ncbi:rhomboid family intramembrane serine protease [Polymorphospora sp. NPDC050346]|uniref:rhomboid family intramembrane serine protease n=1 Tax=Polymorphospora sp. NPDC050346 TaxID=3155780 RepID=UPI0033F12EAF